MNKNKCSFCGYDKDSDEKKNRILIKGQDGYICDQCVRIAYDAVLTNDNMMNKTNDIPILSPKEIKKILDSYVINQDIAKKKLAVAISNQQKMINYKTKYGDNAKTDIEKSNVILVGPTGSGKTFMLRTLAKKLGIPFAIQDATSLTESGYVGDDVENCLRKLIEAADYDIEKAQNGIIYIDEIDKIGRKGENVSLSRDVSGEGVQQALLKIVEGTVAEVPPKGGRKHPNQECVKIDTSNILFIIGGSFEGIEKIIAKRKQGKVSMGIGATVVNKNNIVFNDNIHDLTVEDLKKFGMIPEFLGRFPIIATLEELDENALKNILTEPKNALIKQYRALLKEDNVELKVEPEVLKYIAKEAIKRKTGARGLRAILDEILLPYMYEGYKDTTLTLKVKDNKIEVEKE